MEITIQKSSLECLPKYINLYRACFPSAQHLQSEYLSWFYWSNPVGAVVGADAVCGEEVVGQVLAVPGKYWLRGEPVLGLIAVNVVVHPSFQGRHLFKRLGLRMCDYGAQHGYAFVTGVANAAATPGWIRQMGFQKVSPLEARIGFGGLGVTDFQAVLSASELRHAWTPETLSWRANNPVNKVRFCSDESGNRLTAYASAGKYGISAFAELWSDEKFTPSFTGGGMLPFMPRVFLGLVPMHQFRYNLVNIPERFKPSPLNLIYKNLQDSKDRIDPSACFFNFLDFDAF